MAEKFNIREGLINVLKKVVPTEAFTSAVIRLIFGDKEAAEELKGMMKKESYGQTLNEVVAIHRTLKPGLNENDAAQDSNRESLLKKIAWLPHKSMMFQSKVVVKTLKKPGAMSALLKLIASNGTDPAAWAVLAPEFVSSAIEEAGWENKEEPEYQEQPAGINEQITANKLRRVLKHGQHGKIINEEIDDRYGGRMPVNVYTGRFQPFHLGHLSNLEEAAKRGLRTVICPVMAGKTAKSIAAHPFNGELEEEMFNRLKSAYSDLIADIIPISRPSLDTWVEPIRERGMEPISWTTGMDRKPAYENMVNRYGQDFNLADNFEVIGLEKDMDAEGGSASNTAGISGTAIRQCLVNGDEEGFKRQMPQCLWDMYEQFREALMPAQQTITESKAYKDFRKHLSEGLNGLLK